MLKGKRILLVVSGGIAAYKALELVRRLRERGGQVRAILTAAAAQFVTPLSLAALTEDKVYSDLFSLTDEAEMGHIRLSREADLIVVAPASADLLAKMTNGLADDLASTTLLATDQDILVAPAMNVRMWEHPATQKNIAELRHRGVLRVGPNEGDMACGEYGFGRLAEPEEILAAIADYFARQRAPAGALEGRSALVTSGPTHEAIDPVRFIANRSSGRQGHAIAAALARHGAKTTLVTGPTNLSDPEGVTVVPIESARDMLQACQAALPVDIVVCAAAVADWRIASESDQKLKKNGGPPPSLSLVANPDILATLAKPGNLRPALVVGFAAETENVVEQAQGKRARKGCDLILANDVSPASGTFGGTDNTVHVIDKTSVESWPRMSKEAVAEKLAQHLGRLLAAQAEARSDEDAKG